MAQTNTGHDASKEPSASFVLSNPQKALDYAYRAVHVTAVTAKESREPLLRAAGREGVLEFVLERRSPGAHRGAALSRRTSTASSRTRRGSIRPASRSVRCGINARSTDTHVSADKLALVADRAMQQCDAVDGLRDGLIDDPRECSFDVARDVPSCTAGNAASAMCLTRAEAAAVQKVYDGPQSRGRSDFPWLHGRQRSRAAAAERHGDERLGRIDRAGAAPAAEPADFGLAEGTMRYLVFEPPQAEWDFRTFDFDRHPPLLERWGELANATDTDLRDFRARGGKVLMTYGWADAILQPLMGVDYYEQSRQSERPQRHGLHAACS